MHACNTMKKNACCHMLKLFIHLFPLSQQDFFTPPLASCCKMMNSRMSLAVREGLSITTECPQFSSRSTRQPGNTSAMTAAPETSTTLDRRRGHRVSELTLFRTQEPADGRLQSLCYTGLFFKDQFRSKSHHVCSGLDYLVFFAPYDLQRSRDQMQVLL